jgi:predicted transcriptional regulator
VKEFKVDRDRLVRRRGLRREIGRDVAMYLLGRYSGLSNKKIGELFGVSQSAVSKVIIHVSEQINHQKELRDKVESILNSTFEV